MARYGPNRSTRTDETVHDVAAKEAGGADNHNLFQVSVG